MTRTMGPRPQRASTLESAGLRRFGGFAHRRGAAWGIAAGALLLGLGAAGPASAVGKVEPCLECHADKAGQSFQLPDGATVDVTVTREEWSSSIHASELGCTDCHTGVQTYPHPALTDPDLRSYRLRQTETCRRCHYAHYTRVVDGIHFKQLQEGDAAAPTCVECHGAHDTRDPHASKVDMDARCGTCHEEIFTEYKGSVHGKALLVDGNQDVPGCTDCHGAHEIRDPRQASFQTREHEICAKCHSDEDRMEKYGLNTAVVDTYLDDFHGRSNALYAMGKVEPGRPMASCTDCHGVHDIPSFRAMDDKKAVEARVMKVCEGCHEQIPAGFQDAWLSHYAPTLASAPAVWAVKWFYQIIIPLMLLAFVLHILLHLWRVRMER